MHKHINAAENSTHAITQTTAKLSEHLLHKNN